MMLRSDLVEGAFGRFILRRGKGPGRRCQRETHDHSKYKGRTDRVREGEKELCAKVGDA